MINLIPKVEAFPKQIKFRFSKVKVFANENSLINEIFLTFDLVENIVGQGAGNYYFVLFL